MRSTRNEPPHRTLQDCLFLEEAEEEQGPAEATLKPEEVVSSGPHVSPKSSQCRAVCMENTSVHCSSEGRGAGGEKCLGS